MWVGELPARGATIYALAYAPDNRTLYSGDTQGHVIAWDLATRARTVLFRQRFQHTYWQRHVTWVWPTPDGRRLIVQDASRLIDALHPEAGPVLDPGPGEYGFYQFLFPGERVAVKSDPDNEGRVDWWDLDSGLRLPVPGPLGRHSPGWQALLPDGVTVLTCSSYHKVDWTYAAVLGLWDSRTGERVGNVTPPGGVEYRLSDYWLPYLSPDGRTVGVALNKGVLLYDIPSATLRRQIETRTMHGALALHPNNRLIAYVVASSKIILWDSVCDGQVESFDWGVGKVSTLQFSRDGSTCAAGARGKLIVWDVDVG